MIKDERVGNKNMNIGIVLKKSAFVDNNIWYDENFKNAEDYHPEFLNFFIIESRIPNSWYLQRL